MGENQVKIIDAFLFMDELSLLEIRLNELYSAVDYFVIIESLEMHANARTRKACLANNWDVVKPFERKIKYVVLEQLVPPFTDDMSGWARENYHRNSLMEPVSEIASADDVVIVSDADEIPRATTIQKAVSQVQEKGLHILELDFFYYNVNRYIGPWKASSIGTLKDYVKVGGLNNPRCKLDVPMWMGYPALLNGGWHFSYFGSLADIRQKVDRMVCHYGSREFVYEFLARDDKQAAADIVAGRDLYHRGDMPPFQYRATNDVRLPVHFLNNQKKYEHFTEDFFKDQNRGLL